MTRAPLVAVVALTLAAFALAGCNPTFGGVPTTGRCRVKFAQPYRPRITTGRVLRGDASAVCTGPVDSHHVTLYLERNTGAAWTPVDQDVSDAVPYLKPVALTVVLECRPGTWRLRYDVTATYQGQSAHTNDASDQLTVASQRDCQVAQ
jgi:hypothetical protein